MQNLVFISATQSKMMEDSSPFWKDIEAKLFLQAIVDLVNAETRLASDELHYTPIEQSERKLNLESRIRIVPVLNVVDLVDLT